MAHAMAKQIEPWGNQVHIVEDFRNVMAEFERYDPQLVLLDVMLPFYNGYHWCSEIRKKSNVPVVFILSASDNMNIVMAIHGSFIIQKKAVFKMI
jgi:DNA-binding response OmpR family regulator